jgi:Divergent InlB B-repeat domain
MKSLSRRLRPAGAVVAAAALVMAAGASADSKDRRVLRVGTSGDGVVASADGRIRCGAACSARYERGAVVALRAAPARLSLFERWTEGCVGTLPRCIVALDRGTTVRALFVRKMANLDLAVSGTGTVVSDPRGIVCGSGGTACSAEFPQGVPITLTATPSGDARFGLWGDTCRQDDSAPSCRLILEGDGEVAAAFRPAFKSPGPQNLFVTTDADAKVVSTPPGIDCPTKCDADFPSGATVTLRASRLQSWGVNCVGTASECVLVLDDSTGVSARGSGPPPPPPPPSAAYGVNVSVSGNGFVSGPQGIRCGGATGRLLDCESLYRRGSTLLLQAQPAKKFARWGGFCRGKKPRCSLRVTAPKIVLAAFRR